MKNLELFALFDPVTFTLTYVVWHPRTRDAIVIDSVIDFDPITSMVTRGSLSQVMALVKAKDLNVHWILDTHAHADHLSAARELKQLCPGARWALGRRMSEVFSTFKGVFGWPKGLALQDLGVDRWLEDGEEFSAGEIRIKTIFTPGHTPACVTYNIGSWLFTGDSIFMPDSGVGRCDFPGGDAGTLYDSIFGKLYSLPDDYEVFVGHDYQPGGRPVAYRCRLSEQKDSNIHINRGTSREGFIQFRTSRDKTLKAPRLLEPSLDWNLGAHVIVKR